MILKQWRLIILKDMERVLKHVNPLNIANGAAEVKNTRQHFSNLMSPHGALLQFPVFC